MLSIKFLVEKNKRNSIIKKLFLGTNSFINKYFSNTEIAEDDYNMEIFAGKEKVPEDSVFVEVTIKKKICINIKDLDEKSNLDRVVSEIKFLCEKSKELENYSYKPINFRK